MNHSDPHPLAGKKVQIKEGTYGDNFGAPLAGQVYRLEDWWDRIAGKSWGDCDGNPACIHYAVRTGIGEGKEGILARLDDEVVYGKIGSYGVLLHVTELGEAVDE